MKNKILIMMSTFNGEDFIKEQLDSIMAQTVDFDLLIRDDGSKDSTLEILKKYAKNKSNIRILVGENIGCNQSYFTLLKNAGVYKYYAFSDQDDIWDADKLQIAISTIENSKLEGPLLYGSCSKILKNNIITGTTKKKYTEINFYNTIVQNFLPGHSQVFNYELFKQIKCDLNYDNIYVYDAWITNVAAITGNIIFDNNPHTLYRMHNQNVLGFGENYISWIKNRFMKLINNEISQYSKQITYFTNVYYNDLNYNQKQEMLKFEKSKKNFLARIEYIFKTKLYRQSKIETMYFKILYLLNFYK
ncbi:glycosyltransferase [Massilimicrobiota timonensis]|uniref:Glycosyltransferase 2-like domain-containing protein n=1 Tax=Massilimicrobiota timonensis TaxID=1776392 RepID=A0A1Y4SWP1_9FIRM|nr:glycosyltransferase [Massilimicrobiota timonensis]OUQ33213.1 hypothetical protein B5E75_11135 [Massilimicrobiota timonensis]